MSRELRKKSASMRNFAEQDRFSAIKRSTNASNSRKIDDALMKLPNELREQEKCRNHRNAFYDDSYVHYYADN